MDTSFLLFYHSLITYRLFSEPMYSKYNTWNILCVFQMENPYPQEFMIAPFWLHAQFLMSSVRKLITPPKNFHSSNFLTETYSQKITPTKSHHLQYANYLNMTNEMWLPVHKSHCTSNQHYLLRRYANVTLKKVSYIQFNKATFYCSNGKWQTCAS